MSDSSVLSCESRALRQSTADKHQWLSTISSVFGIVAGISALCGVFLLGAFIHDQQLTIATPEAWFAATLISLVSFIMLIILSVMNYLPIIPLGDLQPSDLQSLERSAQRNIFSRSIIIFVALYQSVDLPILD